LFTRGAFEVMSNELTRSNCHSVARLSTYCWSTT